MMGMTKTRHLLNKNCMVLCCDMRVASTQCLTKSEQKYVLIYNRRMINLKIVLFLLIRLHNIISKDSHSTESLPCKQCIHMNISYDTDH